MYRAVLKFEADDVISGIDHYRMPAQAELRIVEVLRCSEPIQRNCFGEILSNAFYTKCCRAEPLMLLLRAQAACTLWLQRDARDKSIEGGGGCLLRSNEILLQME